MTRFTRSEAEALLPTVRPLMEDVRRRKASYDRRPSAPLANELRSLVGEVAALGVQVKDLDIGLIDFPSVRRGQEILLCWKLGEGDRISWWHDSEAGYRGRRLIEN